MLYLFDVDGTLRTPLLLRPVGSLAPWDQRILPGRVQRLEELRQAGHRVGAVTNQAAIAFGLVTEARAASSLAETNRRLNGALEWIRICPHHPYALVPRFRRRCACRKPAPGMLLEALSYFATAPSDSVFVGDRETDRRAAEAAAMPFKWSNAFFA